MKIEIKLNEDHWPMYMLFIITVKVLYVAFMAFCIDVSTTTNDYLSDSWFITDNFLWIPMLFFFVYFYLYRKGKMSDRGLKCAIACALIAIVPKMGLLVAYMYFGFYKSVGGLISYAIDLVVWALIYIYLISFWYGNLNIKEHRHHHHHHRSSHHHSSSHHHHHHQRDGIYLKSDS